MWEYSQAEKILLGKLIERKRSSLNSKNKQLTIKKLLLISDLNQICSQKTYKKLINGIIVSDDIYEDLLISLGYSADNALIGWKIMNELGTKISKEVEYIKTENIKFLCNQAIAKLNKYQSHFLIVEFIRICTIINDNYSNQIVLTKNNCIDIDNVLKYLSGDILNVLLDIIMNYSINSANDLSLLEIYINKHINRIQNSNYLSEYYYYYLVCNQHTDEATEGMLSLRLRYVCNKNLLRLILLDVVIFDVLNGNKNEKFNCYYKEANLLINQENLEVPLIVKGRLYYRLAMYYFRIGLFKEAYEYFKFCYEQNVETYQQCYFYGLHINKTTGLGVFPFNDNYRKIDTVSGLCYEFYRIKNRNVSDDLLSKYIMQTLKPCVKKKDFLYGIILNELILIVNRSRHFKLLCDWLLLE